MTRHLILALLLFALASCSTATEEPVGIGGDTDELKRSPCACEPFYVNGQWVG